MSYAKVRVRMTPSIPEVPAGEAMLVVETNVVMRATTPESGG